MVGLSAVAMPSVACTPIFMTPEQRDAIEDQHLLEATVLFRGVIEDFVDDGDATMVIRRTRTFWGRGAPARIVIPREYFSNCARGNLHGAVDMDGRFPGLPRVRNGSGVTVLGRPDQASAPWDFIILVDNAPDTQRVLHRFRDLKQAQ
jgi:hypothetical protein